MKEQLSAVELSYALKEWDHFVGAKVEKVFGQEKPDDIFLISFHSSQVGKLYYYIDLKGVVCQVDFKPDFPNVPPHFVASLRRKITNARLQSIEQIGFERIIKLSFMSKHGLSFLYIELLTPGNMILTDESGLILTTLYHKTWNEKRDIRPGKVYVLPEAKKDPRTFSYDEFSVLMQESDSPIIVKSLAMTCSLGGVFAEEVLAQTSISKKTPPKELSDAQLKEIYEALQAVLSRPIAAVRTEDAVFPFALANAGTGSLQKSFNKAIAGFILEKEEAKEQKDLASQTAKRRNKFEKIVFAQQKQLEGLEKKEQEFQAKGELLYEKYKELSTLLYQFNEDSKKLSTKELEKKYLSFPFVSKIDFKEKTITLEVPHVQS
jgi:predicted ribosome quality control (RQC) complex YloA/Tae2 family protein